MGQIQVVRCPACGGSLSYDGGPEISFACQFCGTTVVVPKELRPAGATPAAPPSEPSVAGDDTEQLGEVVRLARAGQEVEAVKLMRELSPDMSLKEALAAVNQLAGQPPAPVTGGPVDRAEVLRLAQAGQREQAIKLLRKTSPASGLTDAVREVDHLASLAAPSPAQPAGGQVSPAAVRKGATAGGAGCTLGCAALVVGVVGFVLALVYFPLRLSGSYDQAVRAAQTNPDVIRAMGTPIEVDWWLPPMGTIRYYSGSCSASYDIWIHGSRKSGKLWVISDSTGRTFFSEGTWTPKYVVTVYYSDVKPIWVR